MFPFSSDTKNMGIMVRLVQNITYYLKGADTVMQDKISSNDAHFMA
jgi:magnesium-transporting ATPase (P-type)